MTTLRAATGQAHAPAHRHSPGLAHEHEFEAAPGLPEALPADEVLLWQGRPHWPTLAREAFHLRAIALYFGALLAWRIAELAAAGTPPLPLLAQMAGPLLLAATGLGTVALLAWLSARTTCYTLTSRRVVMRVGIVLTVTFNVPHRCIAGAALRRGRAGRGSIALQLSGTDRIAWLQLWPHVRPWQLRRAQPMLRALPQVDEVAELLVAAALPATPGSAAALSAEAQAPAAAPAPDAATPRHPRPLRAVV